MTQMCVERLKSICLHQSFSLPGLVRFTPPRRGQSPGSLTERAYLSQMYLKAGHRDRRSNGWRRHTVALPTCCVWLSQHCTPDGFNFYHNDQKNKSAMFDSVFCYL